MKTPDLKSTPNLIQGKETIPGTVVELVQIHKTRQTLVMSKVETRCP